MTKKRTAILTDTGTNVPAEFVKKHDIREVPLSIIYSDGVYHSGENITTDEVIDRFATEIPSTSLPSPDDIKKAIEQAKADGYDQALFITISSGLSATYSTTCMIAEQMPDFPVAVVDTKNIGIGAGVVVMAATKLIEAGEALNEMHDKLEELGRNTRTFFAVKELTYLHHGGRINEATYRLGSMLNIKPVITCDENTGKYITVKKARGWDKALDAEFSLLQQHAAKFPKVVCAVCCTKAEDRLEEFAQRIRENIPNVSEIVLSGISPDLIVHTGPNLVGLIVSPAVETE